MHFQSKTDSGSSKHDRRQRTRQRKNSPRAKGSNRSPKHRTRPKQQEQSNKASVGEDANRLEGEIKWFNRRKNYGFILEDSGEEIFFHQQEVEEDSKKNKPIDKGQRVNFIKTETEKGPQAQRVQIIN